MKKQPFNNRQYIIGILAMLGLMFVQYTFAADLKLDAVEPKAMFKPLFKLINDNIIYVYALLGLGSGIMTQGDLRTKSYYTSGGIICAATCWEATKLVLNIPELLK